MKLFLIFLFLTAGLFAADATEAAKKLGAMNNYETAIHKAQAEKKMLVMVIVKEHCRWCEKLIDRTLSEPEVKKALENDILLIVDRNAPYPSDFNEGFFPSTFFIDYSTGKSVYESAGYVGKKCFLNDLHESQKIRDSLYNSEK